MSELMIDEKELSALSNAANEWCEILSNECNKLNNKEEDIFNRYMAYNKLRVFLEIIPKILQISKYSLINGNNISHPIFQTEEAKKRGWGSIKIDDDPFFTTKQENEKDNELDDHVKSFLKALYKINHSCNELRKEEPKQEIH